MSCAKCYWNGGIEDIDLPPPPGTHDPSKCPEEPPRLTEEERIKSLSGIQRAWVIRAQQCIDEKRSPCNSTRYCDCDLQMALDIIDQLQKQLIGRRALSAEYEARCVAAGLA